MDGLLLFLLAAGLGFVAAIPVGGSQIEMAKRAMTGQWRAAAAVVAGSVSSDTVYGSIALFGLAPLLETRWVLATFSAVAALLLGGFAWLTVHESRRPEALDPRRGTRRSRRWSYVTGFTLAASNPQMVLTWLLGVALAKRLGLATPFPADAKVLFIAGGVLGLAGYLSLLGAVVHRVKHFISVAAIARVYFWLGMALAVLALVFATGAIRLFATAS
ncbi:MAG TPA: LysE family transporter [Gemmatimonadales bacterium]|nr:LysE family transporter [Gemmatimonadales bacterium]